MASRSAIAWALGALAMGMAHATDAAAASSSVCFNDGILSKGSKIDYDIQVLGDGGTPPRRVSLTVGGKKTFNGQQAVETKAEFFDDLGQPAGVNRTYATRSKKFLFSYGLKSKGVEQFFEPAHRLPITLEEGETSKHSYVSRNVYRDGREETSASTDKYTFKGFDEKKFAVGRYRVCVMSLRSTMTAGVGPYLTNRTDWIAAEGPYRGFTLRSKISASYSGGFAINQVIDVTKIRTFDLK